MFTSVALMIFAVLACVNQLVLSDSGGQIQNHKPFADSTPQKNQLYKDMSEDRKQNFVSIESNKMLQSIQNGDESMITPEGQSAIKIFVDSYAKRQIDNQNAASEECSVGDFGKSKLFTILERGAKTAPLITAAFKKESVSPLIGIYVAMIESEFCLCLKSPTGAVGIFQFSKATAGEYGLKASEVTEKPDETDERCQPESASRAAAANFKQLITKNFLDEQNKVTLSVAAWNSGAGSLKKNINTIKTLIDAKTVSFWMLNANKNKLTRQFQTENVKYVPKFFAAAIVGENPRVFGIETNALSSYEMNAVSSNAKVLNVPRNLAAGGIAKQRAKISELQNSGFKMPMDFTDLARLRAEKRLVDVPPATENYRLDVESWLSVSDLPFASFNFAMSNDETRAVKSELKPNSPEYKILSDLANELDGKKHNLNDPADRKKIRQSLLRMLAPEAKSFLEDIALFYKKKFNRPLRISSLVRSMEHQFDLQKVNPNALKIQSAAALPPHVSGYAFDIVYKEMTSEEQNFLMEQLDDYEKAGKIDAQREEGSDSVFHIFVYFDGKPPQT